MASVWFRAEDLNPLKKPKWERKCKGSVTRPEANPFYYGSRLIHQTYIWVRAESEKKTHPKADAPV